VNVVLWTLQILLAAIFLMAGLVKLNNSREQLIESPNMRWVEDVPWPLVRVVAVSEVLAAAGLVVPPLVDVAEILTPLAATGLVIVMVGAIVVHGRRREWQNVAMNVVLLLLAAVVAWGRFGPYAF
jgi:uncharacterized membrane protein YphA (DoxX/SURF4 family)